MTEDHVLDYGEDGVLDRPVSDRGATASDDASRVAEAVSPVEPDRRKRMPEGTALCFSGGGYRAMLFHVGALWRLNELGHLPKLDRVSSVSGGSIAAGALAVAWPQLTFDSGDAATDLVETFVEPLRRLARRTVDVRSVLTAAVTPQLSSSATVAARWRRRAWSRRTGYARRSG